ncbi:MAG TPA: zinc ribbon domain-containing protein [Candidatus Limnocylindrales bacterium]
MIVCKVCGATNEQGATFCGTCGAFLEWSGEQVQDGSTQGGVAPPIYPPPPDVAAPTTGPASDPVPVPPNPEPAPPGSIVCPNCGQINESTRVYCSRCATELAAVAIATDQVVAPPPSSRSIPPVAILGAVGGVVLLAVLAFAVFGPKSTPPPSGAVTEPPGTTRPSLQPSDAVTSAPPSDAVESTPPSNEPESQPPPEVTGTLAFGAEKGDNADIYVWAAGDEKPHKLFGGNGDETDPAWSPDGSKVAFALNVGNFRPNGGTPDEGIRVIKADGTEAKVFDFTHHDVDRNPAWSPDGETIVFASTRDHADNKNLDLYSRVYEATSDEEALADDDADDWDPAWSPDGETIIFVSKRDGPAQLFTMTAEGRRQEALDLGDGVFDDPTYSRVDGLLAYTRREANGAQKQLFVANDDGSDARQVGSFTGDVSDPTWSPDAKLLAVANGDTGEIDIVDVATGTVVESLSVPNATLMQPDWTE